MKMKKFIAVLSVVGMVAAMAAGCGGNSDSKSSADASGSTSDWDSAQISLSYPERTDLVQEELSLNCSV